MCDVIKIGDLTAIICNGKKDHECNEDGAVMILADGTRLPDTKENYEKHWQQVTGGSVCCTICGSAAIDKAMWL